VSVEHALWRGARIFGCGQPAPDENMPSVHRQQESSVKIVKEFREFIDKGNVLDLAVAVVIGAQFNAVITSFTNNVLMQAIGAIFGGKPSFDSYTLTINGSVIGYGSFLTAVINFVIVAFALFVIVKAANKARQLANKGKPTEAEVAATEIDLLTEIRDALVSGKS
jgi:large conductance mechanosensitive channel